MCSTALHRTAAARGHREVIKAAPLLLSSLLSGPRKVLFVQAAVARCLVTGAVLGRGGMSSDCSGVGVKGEVKTHSLEPVHVKVLLSKA